LKVHALLCRTQMRQQLVVVVLHSQFKRILNKKASLF